MAKKAAGTATAEVETRGRLPGETRSWDSESVASSDEAMAPLKEAIERGNPDGPIASLSELVLVAAVVTPADTERLKASGHHFRGGWPGSSLTVNVKLSPEASNTFRAAYIALNRSNARLSDGKHVDSIADTLRWFMERLTEEVGERAGA